MTILSAILVAAAVMALSGVPSFFLPRRSRAAQAAAALLMAAGGALGLASLVSYALGGGAPLSASLDWGLPWGALHAGLDPLSAVFLALAFLIPPLGSIYGLEYWPAAERPRGSRALLASYGLLAAAMALVAIARDGVLFLMGWELMALAGFFAASSSDEGAGLRRAGWIYLIAAHVGALCLFAMFSIWRAETGSFILSPANSMRAGAASSIFLLALAGFGFKAGFVPLQFWLPAAHASAPSHVSAVMSGVMLKMGIYGLLRTASLLPPLEAWQCLLVLGIGALSAVAGIVLATAQRDIKRILAYSSVENLGIIGMGLGLGLLGRSIGRPELAALGIGGALLHAWNHGLFKPLLFMGAGAVMHRTGTRDIEMLGGLAKRTPRLAALFLLGSVAICALPPLNGFASEFLLYVGFFRCLEGGAPPGSAWDPQAIAAIAAAALSLVGALAVACFVRLYSTVFSGEARSEAGSRARECGSAMLLPMAALGALCLALGLAPGLVLGAIDAAVASFLSGGRSAPGLEGALRPLASLAPVGAASGIGAAVAAAPIAAYIAYRARRRRDAPSTWDCGYAAPTSRMQYSASSFGELVVALFAGFLRPRKKRRAAAGAYPAPSRFELSPPDAVLERVAPAASRLFSRLMPRLRSVQAGILQSYLLYILAITIALLLFGGPGAPR